MATTIKPIFDNNLTMKADDVLNGLLEHFCNVVEPRTGICNEVNKKKNKRINEYLLEMIMTLQSDKTMARGTRQDNKRFDGSIKINSLRQLP